MINAKGKNSDREIIVKNEDGIKKRRRHLILFNSLHNVHYGTSKLFILHIILHNGQN